MCGGRTPASHLRAPCNVDRLNIAVRAVKVDGVLDGWPCRMVVDTGAERTFVHKDVVHTQHLPDSQ